MSSKKVNEKPELADYFKALSANRSKDTRIDSLIIQASDKACN